MSTGAVFWLSFAVGFFGTYVYELIFEMIWRRTGKKLSTVIMSYHVHHSMFGVLFVVLALFWKWPLWLGAGLGNIVRHTYYEGHFVFINHKDDEKMYEAKRFANLDNDIAWHHELAE